jgi:hypothetical protein
MATSGRIGPEGIPTDAVVRPRCRPSTVPGVFDILGLDSLFAEMIFGIGLALVAGNLFALWKHQRGERPEGADEDAPFRTGRVVFLTAVGVLMAIWGGVSVFA